jgi:hypothetical protein
MNANKIEFTFKQHRLIFGYWGNSALRSGPPLAAKTRSHTKYFVRLCVLVPWWQALPDGKHYYTIANFLEKASLPGLK